MQILVATDLSTRSNRALRQAGLLARLGNSQLHILHVVEDDQPPELVRMEMREAERVLKEQINSMPELLGTQSNPVVVAGNAFDGILRVASQVQPDVIIMGAHRKNLLLDVFTGTTIERVIRKGIYPVLMVNFEAQRKYERIIAATDLSDSSARALRLALSTGLINDKGATLLHAFVAPAAGKMSFIGSDQIDIDSYLATERQRATNELAVFLSANNLQHIPWSLRVVDGGPMEVISRAVSEMRADLLVLGSQGRSALLKALVGSVTEEALRSLNVDILAVPSQR